MTIIATFTGGSEYRECAGLDYSDGHFTIVGAGETNPGHVAQMDEAGHLVWKSDESREWFRQRFGRPSWSPSQPSMPQPVARPLWRRTLGALGTLFVGFFVYLLVYNASEGAAWAPWVMLIAIGLAAWELLFDLPQKKMGECPYCKEQVKQGATVCRYCRSPLPTVMPSLPKAESPPRPDAVPNEPSNAGEPGPAAYGDEDPFSDATG